MRRCHTEQGHFIPGCMGTAAAMGCGKTLSEIKSYCTCPRPKRKAKAEPVDPIVSRLDRLEKDVAELRSMVERRPGR